jgi:adenosylcobinamide kinase/adenosylcobinamide-phosphate guanylyltransferase
MALIVISGAARSGKSSAAQRLVAQRAAAGYEVVVAVFGRAEDDPEMEARIERHRRERPEGVRTLEVVDVRSWMEHVPDGAVLLLECLGTLAARFMDELTREEGAESSGASLERALDEALAGTVSWLTHRAGDTVIVTNETGWGVVPAYESGRIFRDALGRANTDLVAVADAAYLAINGRLLDVSILGRDAVWPSD